MSTAASELTIKTENGAEWRIEAIPGGLIITSPAGYQFRLDGILVGIGWQRITLKVRPAK